MGPARKRTSFADFTQDHFREIFAYDPDTGFLTWRISPRKRTPVGQEVGHLWKGYRVIGIRAGGKLWSLFIHRVIWMYVHGYWPPNDIDHVNRVTDDNRLVNLREATRSQNRMNSMARKSKSKFKGVFRHANGRYFSRLVKEGQRYYFGSFATADEAHEAYKQGAIEHFGEFARYD